MIRKPHFAKYAASDETAYCYVLFEKEDDSELGTERFGIV